MSVNTSWSNTEATSDTKRLQYLSDVHERGLSKRTRYEDSKGKHTVEIAFKVGTVVYVYMMKRICERCNDKHLEGVVMNIKTSGYRIRMRHGIIKIIVPFGDVREQDAFIPVQLLVDEVPKERDVFWAPLSRFLVLVTLFVLLLNSLWTQYNYVQSTKATSSPMLARETLSRIPSSISPLRRAPPV